MLHYSLFSHRLAPVSKRNRFLLYSTTGLSHSHDNDNATRNTFSKTADNDVTNTTVTTDGATGVTMQLTSDDVEFYLYPTVGTVLIHSVKPELTE